MNKYRTHKCNELRKEDVDKKISLSGWINKKRDHGNLLFIDLRDNYGITQCIINKDNKYFSGLEKMQLETVIKVEGKVVNRSKENLEKEKEAVSLKLKELGVEDKLINLKGITQGMLVILGQKNIKKLSDFADLSSDELIGGFDEIKGKKIRIEGYLEEFSLSRKEADDLIMSAREIVYK